MPVKLGSAFGMIRIGYDGAGVAQALAGLGGLTQTLTAIGHSINTMVIRPLVGLGREVMSVGSDFESQMAILELAAGKGEGALYDLEAASIAVGSDTRLVGISASESAEAMTNFYKAGLDTADVFGDLQGYMAGTTELGGALKAAIDLAAASDLDLAQASDAVAIAMKTFNLEAEDSEQIANSFVRAADASVAEVGELVAAMGNIGPVAARLGFSIEDVNTALAIMSESGIRGAEAGTGMKSMLTNLLRPTNKVKDAMRELKVDMYDLETGVMRPLPDILADLNSALYGTSDAWVEVGGRTTEQQKDLERLQKRYTTVARNLSDYERGIKGIGQTEKTRAKTMENYALEMAALSGEIENLNAIKGDSVKVTKELTQKQRDAYILDIAGSYGQTTMGALLGENRDKWGDMATAIDSAATASEVAAVRTDTFEGAVEGLEGVLETIKIQLWNVVKGPMKELAFWAGDMASEYGPMLISWFKDVSAEAGLFLKSLEPVLTWLGGLIEEFIKTGKLPQIPWKKILPPWLIKALEFAAEGVEFFQKVWEDLKPELKEIWEAMGTELMPILEDLKGLVGGDLSSAWETLGKVWDETVFPMIQQFLDFAQGRLRPALITLAGIIVGTVIVALISLAAAAVSAAIPIIAALLPILIPILLIGAAVALLYQAWQSNWLGIGDALTAAWEFIRPTFELIQTWLAENIPLAIAAVSEWWETTMLPALTTVADYIMDTLVPAFLEIWTWLSEKVTTAVEDISTLWEETLLPALTAVWEFITLSIVPVFQGIIDVLVALGLKIGEFLVAYWEGLLLPALTKLWDFIVISLQPVLDGLKKFWEDFTPIIEVIAKLIGEGLQKAWDALMTSLSDAKEKVLDPLAKAFEWIRDALGEVADLLGSVATGIGNVKIPDWLKGKSPPPMANWFSDIAGAMRGVADVKLPNIGRMMRVNQLPVPAGAGAGGGTVNQYDQRTQIPEGLVQAQVNNEVDVESLAYRVAQVIQRRNMN